MCLKTQLGAVRSWQNKFESIKNTSKSGRPKFASRMEIVSKIKEIIQGDARFTLRDMFQTCDKKQFANVVTGDENWV